MSGRTRSPKHGPDGLVFPNVEDSNWEWDEKAGQYYLHRFYKHQPDLNIDNPEVQDEIRKIIGFWLEVGLSGFRVDAVPFPARDGRHRGQNRHRAARLAAGSARSFMVRRRGDAILMGEVNLEYEDVRRFLRRRGRGRAETCASTST